MAINLLKLFEDAANRQENPTAEDLSAIAKKDKVAAEWELHSQGCERVQDLPAGERVQALRELDAEFQARGIIDPAFRG